MSVMILIISASINCQVLETSIRNLVNSVFFVVYEFKSSAEAFIVAVENYLSGVRY